MERGWFKFFLIYSSILLTVAIFILGSDLYRLWYQPMLPASAAPIIIQLDKQTTASGLVKTLQAKRLLSASRLFLLSIRIQGLAHDLKAGIYQIQPGESAQTFLKRIVAGDVLRLTFPIIEGTTEAQVIANLEKAPYLHYQKQAWKKIKEDYPNAEGLLLAETYYYEAGSNASTLLQQAHQNLQKVLTLNWNNRTPGLPYKSPYQLLVVASILEKETAIAEEKRLIASVIVNRLRKRMPLQVDPTVIYALGPNYQGKLAHDDLSIDSPYNTYRNYGLPPTPIAMVSASAIEAAAHPKVTDYLYFVAKGDGSHFFSTTYDQQKAAIRRYLRKSE